MSGRETRVRKADQVISRLIELWPIWGLLATGLVAGIRFYSTVNDLAADQKAWRASAEQRRERTRQEMEEIRQRITVLETRMEDEHFR